LLSLQEARSIRNYVQTCRHPSNTGSIVHTYIFTYSHERSKRPFILELYVCLGFVLVFVLTQEKQKSYYGAPIPATTNTPVMHEHVQLINVLFLGLNLAGSIGRCNCQCVKYLKPQCMICIIANISAICQRNLNAFVLFYQPKYYSRNSLTRNKSVSIL